MTFTLYDADMTAIIIQEKVNDTTLSFSPDAAVPVDKLAVVQVAWDNLTGTAANDTTFLTVSDTKSNTWVRAAECQYAETVAQDGLLAGVYYSVITTQIETTDTITVTAGTSLGVLTAKTLKLAAFSRDTSKTIAVADKGYGTGNESTTYSATVSALTSEEHLWIGVNAMELPAGTNTRDAGYGVLTGGTSNQVGTSGGATSENVSLNSGYLISTGTTETYDNTIQASGDRVTILVAFREVSAAGGAEMLDPMGMRGFFGG